MEGAGPLLDWLGVAARNRYARSSALGEGESTLGGLLLLDLPDHDSVLAGATGSVNRLVSLADLMVWVLDPQKYADAAVHSRYLVPMAGHSSVISFVLNQADLLTQQEAGDCVEDLQRLLEVEGLHNSQVLVTSAVTGAGIDRLREVLIGFVIATAAGVGLAVLLHLYGPLRRAFYPILIGSQTIPIIVLAPILVILLGYGILPKLVIVALICFFPIVVNGLDGLRAVDDDFIRMMYTLDATRWGIFRRVEFPGALPSFFSGMRIAATFASIGAVFGEWSGSNAGLGFVMLEATPNLLTSRIFAAILMLTVISLVLFGLVSLLERIAVPWAPRRESA